MKRAHISEVGLSITHGTVQKRVRERRIGCTTKTAPEARVLYSGVSLFLFVGITEYKVGSPFQRFLTILF